MSRSLKLLGLAALAVFGLAAASGAQAADDTRIAVAMPEAAARNLRLEMVDNLRALNEIQSLLAAGKLAEAGPVAEKSLGIGAMGRHRSEPMEARPGAHMPPEMHAIGIEGHRAASEFARVAATGDRDQALSALTGVYNHCVACHSIYRIR